MRSLVLAVVCACHSSSPQLYPAGSDRDDGHGWLAQASSQYMTEEGDEEGLDTTARRRGYGGDSYGGDAYGNGGYGSYTVPAWPVQPPDRTPKYKQVPVLTGAIEGTIALRTAKLATSCGDASSPRVAIVYIEKVQVGRTLSEGRPASVGGTIVKHGCALSPVAQLVTPLPAALAVNGDAKPARIRIASKAYDLQAAGRVSVQLQAGLTRIDAEGGTLGAAWVLAVDTPYYAVTDEQGRFRIDELAAGTYEVTIWQPPIGKVTNGVVAYGEPTVTKRMVKVDDKRTSRLDLR